MMVTGSRIIGAVPGRIVCRGWRARQSCSRAVGEPDPDRDDHAGRLFDSFPCLLQIGGSESGLVDDVSDIVPHVGRLCCHGCERSNHRDNDQRQNQAVFDGSRTSAVAQDCAQNFCHDLFPVFCSLVGGYELSPWTLRNC